MVKTNCSIKDKSLPPRIFLVIVLPHIYESNPYLRYITLLVVADTAKKVSKCEFFFGQYFPVFSPNMGKHGPERSLYLDTFYAVGTIRNFLQLIESLFIFFEYLFFNRFCPVEKCGATPHCLYRD